MLSQAFTWGSTLRQLKHCEAKLTDKMIQTINEVKAWGNQGNYWTKPIPIDKLVNTLEDKKIILHMVYHAALGHNFISNII